MAYDFNKLKSAWDQMDENQRKQMSQQYANNADFQRFTQEYNNGGVSNTGSTGTDKEKLTGYSDGSMGKPQEKTDTSHYDPLYFKDNSNSDNGNGGNGENYYNNGYSSDGNNGDGNQYGRTTFDKEEKLDESMFKQDPGKITIEQGRGKETGRPDYELDTEERLNEMRGNLDHYWATDKSLFSSRERFNEFFQYNQRKSQAQRDLLDSYWRKAQDYNAVSQYTTGDSVSVGLNNGNFTESQFNALKEFNPEAFLQWQKKQAEELNLAIANMADKFDVDTVATALEKVVNKLNIDPGDPRDIIGGWENMMEKTGAWDSLREMDEHAKNASQAAQEMQRITQRYASSTGGSQSDALVAARLQKALTPYQQIYSDEYNLYQMSRTSYQTKMGTATEYANTIQKQAQEDQRIFQDKLSSLGFAMQVYSYRTPEQQAQLNLQVQSIKNNMDLLNTAQKNDLALYNKYATAMLDNQIEGELSNLDVEDPAQQRANLNRVVGQYFEKYGDIIQRSQSQVVDDVLAYAKKNGISVGQALKENFIKPLQNKKEYAQAIANKYGTNPKQSIQKIGDKTALVTTYPNGKMSYQILDDVYDTNYDIKKINGREYLVVDDGNGVPQIKFIGGDGTVLNYGSLVKGLNAFEAKWGDEVFYKDKGCGYFVNDFLTSIGDTGHVGSSWESKKALCKNKDFENMVVGSVVAIDSKATYTDENGNKVNAGHVSIVAGYDPTTGKVTLYDANAKGDGYIRYWDTTVDKLYGYYTPEVYKTAGSDLPDYLSNMNEYGFIDSMTGTYGKYLAGDITTQKRIDNLGGDAVIQTQIENWLNYLNTQGKNKNGYIDGAEDLYEMYLQGKTPSASYLRPLGGLEEFISQAKAYGEKAGYGRYAKTNSNGYFDDLVPLYNEYIISNNSPTEAQVKDYGGLDDFYKTARAYQNANGYIYSPEQKDKEISDMRDKWLTSQEYKDMAGRIDALQSINAMLTSGKGSYGDYTAIYLLNKLRDPSSVVREGEFANTQNVGGIDDKIYNYFKQLQNGERLNDSQRLEIMNTLNELMKAKVGVYNNSLREYRSHAIKGGDTSKIGTLYQVTNTGKVNFGDLTNNEVPEIKSSWADELSR